jgi:propionyl-CoA carboxylase beta chain
MGPKGAAEIIFRKEIQSSKNPKELLAQKEKEYREKFANPYLAAERGYVDEVIYPTDTRLRLIQSLQMIESKVEENPGKKHGNIPL